MVYGIQLKNLVLLLSGGGEVATFGRSLLSGGRYFRESLLSGFTSGHKKMTLISGGRYYRKLTVLLYVFPESTASVALRHLRK